ncbi:hypothetical protein [Pseudomonas putida]
MLDGFGISQIHQAWGEQPWNSYAKAKFFYVEPGVSRSGWRCKTG